MKRFIVFLLCVSAAIPGVACRPQSVNPLDYGLKEAKNGVERFHVIRRCHEDAIRRGLRIDYSGIDTVFIDIPENAKEIPLPKITDFAGAVIAISNQKGEAILFSRCGKATPIKLSGKEIDKGDFRKNLQLNKGRKILVLQDENPWINTRIGYHSTATYKRYDVLVVEGGKAKNATIMPYDNPQTQPQAWVCDVGGDKTVVKNLQIVRLPNSTFITYPFSFRLLYDLEVSNVTITTPKVNITSGDRCITIHDCAKIRLNDIVINNTYSRNSLTGYGMRLLNVYDVVIKRMVAHCNWGVFGNYNVSRVLLEDCDINRFDVHYYGKDIKALRCTFREKYNQFASVYGDIIFDKCEFINFRPVLIESSFNAYTPFNLTWMDCVFHLDKKFNYLVTLFGVPEPYNDRKELERKSLPNITVKNCRVILDDEIKNWYLVWTGGVSYKDSFDYMTDVRVEGLEIVNGENKKFDVFSEKIKTTNSVNIVVEKK